MAQGQVGARTAGDVYQGLFFWRQAANLLRPETMVTQVDIEHDNAAGVDDVAVFYESPFVTDGETSYTADFYQVKYHVDNRNFYCSSGLVDPTFVNPKSKTSILQKFFNAYKRLKPAHSSFRLSLISNWRLKDDDPLALSLRECDGKLPEQFFTGGAASDFGKIRTVWAEHLEISDPVILTGFLRSLRFGLSHFGRRDFKELVNLTLLDAGLKVPSADHSACPYDSLIQQFLMNGNNSFNRATFKELVTREGLLSEGRAKIGTRLPALGVRYFSRAAENLEMEVRELVCCLEYFSGRHPRDESGWEKSARRLLDFFGDPDRTSKLRKEPHSLHLECHGTAALLAGYALSRNSGAQVYPIQKPGLEVWRPDSTVAESEKQWSIHEVEMAGNTDEIAVGLSVTHQLEKDVGDFIRRSLPSVSKLAILSPVNGPGPNSVSGGQHAYALASSLSQILAELKPARTSRVHLFFACPVALLFFIGQLREALGRLTIYEFDFGMEKDCSYKPSISLPLASTMA